MRRVVGEADPPPCQRTDIRGGDLGAIAADIRPPHVVHEDDDDVRRPRRWAQRQLPMRFGFLARALDLAGKARILFWFAGNRTILSPSGACSARAGVRGRSKFLSG